MAIDFGNLPSLDDAKMPDATPLDNNPNNEGGGDPKAPEGSGGGLAAVAGQLMQLDNIRASKAPELFENEARARASYNTALGGLVSNVDAAKNTVNDAGDKLLGASSVPAGVGKILSWFGNSDYDANYQKQRIDTATRNLTMDGQRVSFLGQIADDATRQATEGRQSAQNLLQTYLSLKSDSRADAQLGLAAAADARAAAEHKVTMQFNDMKLQNAAVDRMSTLDIESAVKNPSLLPNLPQGYLQQELNRRKSAETSLANASAILESTQLGNSEKKIALAQQQIKTGLLNLPGSMFSQYYNQALKQGYVDIDLGTGHQSRLSDMVMKQFANERAAEENKRAKDSMDVYMASVSNPVNSSAVGAAINLMQSDDGYLSSLTPGEVGSLIAKKELADKLTAQQGAMPQLGASKIFEDLNKFVDETQQRYLKAAPEKERQALAQFHSTGGKITDTSAASDFYTSRASKTPVSPLMPNNLWAGADSSIRADLAQRLKDTAGISPQALGAAAASKGGMYLPNGKLPEDQLMQLTLNENGSKYKADVLNRMTAKVLAGAIGDLATGDPTQNRPAIGDFANIYSNGEFTAPYKKNGALDESAIYNFLIRQDATTGSNNVSILKAMLNNAEYRKKFVQSEEAVNNTPEQAALRRILFQGDVSQVFPHINMRLDHSVSLAADQAARTAAEMTPPKSFIDSLRRRTPGVN